MSPTADLVARLQEHCPAFNTRPLTWADAEVACAQERLDLVLRPWRYDEQMFRRARRIVIDAKLAPTYRTFVAWHALGHWFLHPGDEGYYLERGWLNPIEREASLVGFLALAPWPNGPPYPQLRRASAEDEQLVLEVAFPHRQPDGQVVWQDTRWVRSKKLHGVSRLTLPRYA